MGKKLKTSVAPEKKIGTLIAIVLLVALYIFLFLLDNALPTNSTTIMLTTVLKKGVIYALVCVSMNLLNGFTGLFSLGQAGFMLIGAYAYAIFSIPAEQHASVYQYFDGGAIQFSIPQIISMHSETTPVASWDRSFASSSLVLWQRFSRHSLVSLSYA